jgi:hypothetical protein
MLASGARRRGRQERRQDVLHRDRLGVQRKQPPGPLLSATVPLSWPKVVQYTISDKGGWRRPLVPNIFWYRLINGNAALENAFDFTLSCKGVTEW